MDGVPYKMAYGTMTILLLLFQVICPFWFAWSPAFGVDGKPYKQSSFLLQIIHHHYIHEISS
jgi:hypothetical protein